MSTESPHDGDVTYRVTPTVFALSCPDCGETATGSVNLGEGPRFFCEDCSTRWQPGDRDVCARCEKPLGGSEILCHSCEADLDGGEA